MLIVVCTTEKNKGKYITLVSHGYNTLTDQIFVLPQVSPLELDGAYFDKYIGEWVLG